MRIFNNTNQLLRSIILRRLQALDTTADCNPYKGERLDHSWCYYIGVESTLPDAQIEACLGPMTQADTDAEKAHSEKAAALEKLADWMQKNPSEAVKLLEATSKVTALETKVAAIEAKVEIAPIEPKAITK